MRIELSIHLRETKKLWNYNTTMRLFSKQHCFKILHQEQSTMYYMPHKENICDIFDINVLGCTHNKFELVSKFCVTGKYMLFCSLIILFVFLWGMALYFQYINKEEIQLFSPNRRYHQVVLIEKSSLTLCHYPSPSCIAPEGSTRLYPVSAQI